MNDQTPTNELVEVRALVAADVFGPGGAEAVIKALTDKVLAVETDISTPAGRKAIASLAYKVARSKTALDEMGKDLAAELKKRTGAIDTERRHIRESLDALQERVRKPLTNWENAEKARVAAHEAALAAIVESPDYGRSETAAEIRQRLELLLDYPPRDWQEFAARATKALDDEIERTTTLWEAARTREEAQAAAERLQAEQLALEQQERDARIAAEAAEDARREVEETARLELQRAEQEKAAAEQAARDAEERAIRAETERVAAETRAREEAEVAAQRAEHEKLVAIEAERQRVADEQAAEARETAKREADREHRAKINGAARDALVAAGLTVEQAVFAVMAIVRGDVPNVKISY